MTPDDPDTTGVVIVTGGTRGIGLAAARCIAQTGRQVIISGRDPTVGAAAAETSPGVLFRQADVADEQACRSLMQFALDMGQGRIRGLVNNAGMGARHDFREATLQDWDLMMQVNARSVFHMTRLATEGLIAARGAVVNVASVAGLRGEESLALYTASKAAIIGLTQSLALELGDRVRFNAVCPGQVATRMMGRVLSDIPHRQALEMRIPVGRLARPDDVAEVIAWLLSDAARYVNGAVIPVDGGETAGLRQPRFPDRDDSAG